MAPTERSLRDRREVCAARRPPRRGEAAAVLGGVVHRPQLAAVGDRHRSRRRSFPGSSDGVDSSPPRRREHESLQRRGLSGEPADAAAGRQLRARREPAGRAGLLPPPARGGLRARRQGHVAGPVRPTPASTAYWDYDEDAQGDDVLALLRRQRAAARDPPHARADRPQGARDAGGVPPDETPPPELEAAAAAAYLEEFREAYPGLAPRSSLQLVGREGFGDARPARSVPSPPESHALLRDDDVLHEGDWERMTVYLDKTDPFERRARVGRLLPPLDEHVQEVGRRREGRGDASGRLLRDREPRDAAHAGFRPHRRRRPGRAAVADLGGPRVRSSSSRGTGSAVRGAASGRCATRPGRSAPARTGSTQRRARRGPTELGAAVYPRGEPATSVADMRRRARFACASMTTESP